MKNTKTVIVAGLFLIGLNAVAGDTITLKWEVIDNNPKSLIFRLPANEPFTVKWGDGADSNYIGAGNAITTAYHSYGSSGTVTVTIITDTTFRYFSCLNQRVTFLDVRKSPKLEELYCYINLLDSLDVSQNTWLSMLHCQNNSLTRLDVSENTMLENLNCSNNRLDSLNTSGLNQLTTLNCSYNSLRSLFLDKTNKSLSTLNCSHNLLTDLDVKTDINLYQIDCFFNLLEGLDVSRNTKLTDLNCSSNQINDLDLTYNTSLSMLYCDTNRLLLSDLFAASQIAKNDKRLGRQTPLPQTVCIGKAFLPQQSVFGGIPTSYTVTKNGSPAPAGDYTVNNGVITFNTLGNYTVKMTNTAIISDPNYPAEVIIDVTVREASTDATLFDITVSEGVLTPDFNSSIENYTVNVAEDISSIIITATLSDSNAVINGDTGIQILQTGTNTFTITVTAEDDATEKNYTITVNCGDVRIVETDNNTYLPRIYPNPTTGKFTILDLRLDDLKLNDLQLEIYDVVGNLLQSKTANQQSKIEIDISHLANGLYFLNVNGKMVKVVKE